MATDRDPKMENERELQPDPLMKEGRASQAWTWTVGFAILVIALVTFFAISGSNNGPQTAQHASRFTTGASNSPPRTALPAGRTDSHAPKEGDYHTVR